jgi:basic membrane protein A
MRKFMVLGMLALASLAVVAGRADARPVATANAGMVTTVGGLGDRGFNDLAWKGLNEAKASLGSKIKVLEPTSPSQYVDNLTQLAQNDYLAFGVGYLFTDAITEVAKSNPDKHFAIIDSVVQAPNVVSLTFHEEQGSYLAGVLAANMTKRDTPYTKGSTKVVGFLGAIKIPIIQKFQAGFAAGVKSVDPSIKVLVRYVGTTADAFVNPQAGYEISNSMNNKGADVIFHAAGSTGAGLFKSAKEHKYFAIGVDTDQSKSFKTAPILTSMLKRVDVATFKAVKAEADGKFPGGKQLVFGIPEGGIALAPYYSYGRYVPASVKAALKKAQANIVSGKVRVPTK